MLRQIITIDEEKCNGCGLCVNACKEGALALADGKARLTREDYCDGLGNCLPACPQNAITFTERDAAPFDEQAVKISAAAKLPCGCPGTHAKKIERKAENAEEKTVPVKSRLSQWPCQIRLVPVNAPYFNNADVLIAADCTAYAYGDLHNGFIKDRITLIGCPKLDDTDYSEKLTEIFKSNAINSVCVVRMEVPCCGGIEYAVKAAVQNSGKTIPLTVSVISTNGNILDRNR